MLKLEHNPYNPPNEENCHNSLAEAYREAWDTSAQYAAEEIVRWLVKHTEPNPAIEALRDWLASQGVEIKAE